MLKQRHKTIRTVIRKQHEVREDKIERAITPIAGAKPATGGIWAIGIVSLGKRALNDSFINCTVI